MYNVANEIPGIEHKRYLELGILSGSNRDLVKAVDKVSVDIIPNGNPTYVGTTDEFFFDLDADERFDVAYIDACHDFLFVWRDFNNTVLHLNERGIIMCHDLVPPDESGTAHHLSGDAYKLLALIFKRFPLYKNWKVMTRDSGLGVFVDPPYIDSFDYDDFREYPWERFAKLLDEIRDSGHATESYEDLYAFVRTAEQP